MCRNLVSHFTYHDTEHLSVVLLLPSPSLLQNTKECRDGKLFNLSNTKISMAFCQSPSEKKPRQQVIKRAIYADN